MKVTLFIVLLLVFTGITAKESKNYKIYDSSTKEEISLTTLANRVSAYNVIFFGEFHDDATLHKLEADLLTILRQRNRRIAISMEMFERDVQPELDKYLQGRISEDEFLKNSRPWPNYKTDYRPIIEFAKKRKIPVIAGNVPRRYASMVNTKGQESLKKLPKEEKKYIAKELKVIDDDYKKKFENTMKAMGNSPMAVHMAKVKNNMYAAQCLKDDTMAESIFEFLKKHPTFSVIHFNGEFHSNSHLGTAQKLALFAPNKKICVITPVEWEQNKKIVFPEDKAKEGDFLIVVGRKDIQK